MRGGRDRRGGSRRAGGERYGSDCWVARADGSACRLFGAGGWSVVSLAAQRAGVVPAAGDLHRDASDARRDGMTAVKTDRIDALAIAQAMRVGWCTVVHVKSAASRRPLLVLRNRKALVEQRVGLDSAIRGTLKAFGIKLGKVSEARFAEAVETAIKNQHPALLVAVEPCCRCEGRCGGHTLHCSGWSCRRCGPARRAEKRDPAATTYRRACHESGNQKRHQGTKKRKGISWRCSRIPPKGGHRRAGRRPIPRPSTSFGGCKEAVDGRDKRRHARPYDGRYER
jgi:hypothetical protein